MCTKMGDQVQLKNVMVVKTVTEISINYDPSIRTSIGEQIQLNTATMFKTMIGAWSVNDFRYTYQQWQTDPVEDRDGGQ